jgi:ATP-binding cassette subfamily B (MDR/TAP) protein 1
VFEFWNYPTFTASWQLALVILALIPLIGINGVIQMKFMKGFSADAKVCP